MSEEHSFIPPRQQETDEATQDPDPQETNEVLQRSDNQGDEGAMPSSSSKVLTYSGALASSSSLGAVPKKPQYYFRPIEAYQSFQGSANPGSVGAPRTPMQLPEDGDVLDLRKPQMNWGVIAKKVVANLYTTPPTIERSVKVQTVARAHSGPIRRLSLEPQGLNYSGPSVTPGEKLDDHLSQQHAEMVYHENVVNSFQHGPENWLLSPLLPIPRLPVALYGQQTSLKTSNGGQFGPQSKWIIPPTGAFSAPNLTFLAQGPLKRSSTLENITRALVLEPKPLPTSHDVDDVEPDEDKEAGKNVIGVDNEDTDSDIEDSSVFNFFNNEKYY